MTVNVNFSTTVHISCQLLSGVWWIVWLSSSAATRVFPSLEEMDEVSNHYARKYAQTRRIPMTTSCVVASLLRCHAAKRLKCRRPWK